MHSNETVAAVSPTGTRRDRRQFRALTQEDTSREEKKEEKPKEKTNSRRDILTLKKLTTHCFQKDNKQQLISPPTSG